MSSCCQVNYRPKLVPSVLISILLVFVFSFLQKYTFFSVSSASSLFAFYLFGVLAGFSTCSPITTSLFLSYLPQKKKALFFLIFRLLAFIVFGYLLGIIGTYFHLSVQNIAISSLIVSFVTLFLSLNFLKIISLNSFHPKNSSPIITGLLTFFLPCGFTLTTQSIALFSGNPMNSSSILAVFCLGTLSPLFLLYFGFQKLKPSPTFTAYLNQVLGLLLLLFSLYSLNSWLSLLNLPSISFAKNQNSNTPQNIIKMSASSTAYSPNYFQVRAGQKIRWEVTNQGTSGCTNAILAPSLFKDIFNLAPYTVSVKEFIAPTTPGIYRFSCWMGMISGTIEVIP